MVARDVNDASFTTGEICGRFGSSLEVVSPLKDVLEDLNAKVRPELGI